MSIPAIKFNVTDGNLGLTPSSALNVPLYMGIAATATPNVLYSVGSQTVLASNVGVGKGEDALAYLLSVAGGPALFMALNPSVAGGVSGVTHSGTGAGTVAVSSAPFAAITVTIVLGGVLNTATATFQVGTGPVGPVTLLPTGGVVFVNGSFTTLTFAAGTYVAADTYVIAVDGSVTHTGSGSPANPTQSSSPVDNYNAIVNIVTSGALATAQFTYSLDNGEPKLNGGGVVSSTITTTGGGKYAIPGSGVVLTFASTFVAGDTYKFTTAGMDAGPSDVAAAYTALTTTYKSAQYGIVYVMGCNALSSAWATQCGALETDHLSLFNSNIYERVVNECPTLGSISASAGAVVVNVADTDTQLTTSRAGVSAIHVIGAAGDCGVTSPLTGLTLRRNAAFVLVPRMMQHEPSRNPGEVDLGGLPGVAYLYRDEAATPALDAQGFTTLRTWPGASTGFFVTDCHTLTVATSDYYPATNARVVDEACATAFAAAAPLILSKVPTTTRNGQAGVITEKKAQSIENGITAELETVMVNVDPADAVAVGVTVDRTHNILADGQLIMTGAVQPFAYAKSITFNIGLTVAV
jgi:Protein of unknown function (DUF2586)